MIRGLLGALVVIGGGLLALVGAVDHYDETAMTEWAELPPAGRAVLAMRSEGLSEARFRALRRELVPLLPEKNLRVDLHFGFFSQEGWVRYSFPDAPPGELQALADRAFRKLHLKRSSDETGEHIEVLVLRAGGAGFAPRAAALNPRPD